jgi:N-acetylglucosaminyldiphosphoundecaprenol N-acetyl-beta-D-mannosaminyltransferase
MLTEAADTKSRTLPPTYELLGTHVAVTSPVGICELIESWKGSAQGRSVCFSDVHGIVKGHDDPRMKQALADADVVCPDGHPVALAGRWIARQPAQRTCGPDTLVLLSSRSPKSGLRHFFYGGAPGVAEALAANLQDKFPGLVVAGFDSPPMRPLTPEEDAEAVQRILASKPDVLWVGLGAPKQEIWMMEHKPRLPGVTLLGVGAAFDFQTGRVRRAPRWMQKSGLEWLYRAASEPKRLGKRYAVVIPRFVHLSLRQAIRGTSAS